MHVFYHLLATHWEASADDWLFRLVSSDGRMAPESAGS